MKSISINALTKQILGKEYEDFTRRFYPLYKREEVLLKITELRGRLEAEIRADISGGLLQKKGRLYRPQTLVSCLANADKRIGWFRSKGGYLIKPTDVRVRRALGLMGKEKRDLAIAIYLGIFDEQVEAVWANVVACPV